MKHVSTGGFLFTVIGVGLMIAFAAFATEQIQQFANSDPLTWQNGNLHSGNSQYVEGDSVPFRNEIIGIPENSDGQFEIHYDFTKDGIHAFDFLTSYDLTEAIFIANCFKRVGETK
jgi:hypothetical protein